MVEISGDLLRLRVQGPAPFPVRNPSPASPGPQPRPTAEFPFYPESRAARARPPPQDARQAPPLQGRAALAFFALRLRAPSCCAAMPPALPPTLRAAGWHHERRGAASSRLRKRLGAPQPLSRATTDPLDPRPRVLPVDCKTEEEDGSDRRPVFSFNALRLGLNKACTGPNCLFLPHSTTLKKKTSYFLSHNIPLLAFPTTNKIYS